MLIEKIARTGETSGKFGTLAGVAAPEAARAVAKAVVPLGEAGRVVAKLIPAWSYVPWFGDELDARQDRVLAQSIEKS